MSERTKRAFPGAKKTAIIITLYLKSAISGRQDNLSLSVSIGNKRQKITNILFNMSTSLLRSPELDRYLETDWWVIEDLLTTYSFLVRKIQEEFSFPIK